MDRPLNAVALLLVAVALLMGCSADDEKDQADLVCDDAGFIVDGSSGDVTGIEVEVSNRDHGDADRFYVRIAVNGSTVAVVQVDELFSRSTKSISIPLVLDPGYQQIQIYVDSSGLIDESDESNNVFLLTTTISG